MAKTKKQKKESMLGYIIPIVFLILFVTSFGWMIYSSGLSKETACKNLDYDSYNGVRLSGIYAYCVDSNGNLHTVRMECTGFFVDNCIAKNIKIQSYNP